MSRSAACPGHGHSQAAIRSISGKLARSAGYDPSPMGGTIGRTERRDGLITLALILAVVSTYLVVSIFVGPIALLIVAGLVVAILVLQRPALALALVIVPTVLIEDSREGGFLPELAGFYDVHVISPFEGLVALAVAATVLDVAHRGRLRLPDPLTLPLLLAGVAVIIGVAVGCINGAGLKEALFAARPFAPLILLPFVVVNALRDRTTIRRALIVAAALAGAKAGLGLIEIAVGMGFGLPGDPPITYLEPTVNWLCIAAALVLVARLMQRRSTPLWLLVISLISVASLILSYRRSFWIAAVLGLLIVVLIGLQQRRWLSLIPGVVAVAFAVWLSIGTGVIGEVHGPIADRAESLSPAKIQNNEEDRYRIGERRNLIAQLEEDPLTGIGFAVPWVAQYPLSVDREGSRLYAHFTALSWWLKLGIFGLLAYLAIVGTSIWSSYRVWREHSDPWFQAVGLAMVGAFIGLAVAETSASFTGITPRLTAVFAVAVGIIVAMLSDARGRPSVVPSRSRY
jgi:O-antigen ligase